MPAFEQAYPKYVHWLETYPRYTTARADLGDRAAEDPDALIKQSGAESTCEALAESLGQLNAQFARATKDFDFDTLPKPS